MSPESLDAIKAICRAHNRAGVSMLRRDEDEPDESRAEDVDEVSDLDLMGRFERFTPNA